LQKYLDLFDHIFDEQNIRFVEVMDLSQIHNEPVLIIQDHNKEDFLEGGILYGQIDPYRELYGTYSDLPKQSFSINPNKSADSTPGTYLEYDLPAVDSKSFQVKLEAALEQLYLKDVVLCERSAWERLPYMPQGLIFLRKARSIPDHDPYETLLYVEHNRLHFIDLRDPAQRILRDELLAQLGISWDEMEEHMLRKYQKFKKDNGESESSVGKEDQAEMARYDCIAGRGFFVELEDLNERVLYDYDEIVRRQTEVKTALPIEGFKLLAHYNKLRNQSYLLLEGLQERGLLDGKRLPKNKDEEASLIFYRQLEAYDEYLDELLLERDDISFNELWDGESRERIISIFDIKPNKNGKYTNRQYKELYQKLGWFSSDKSEDVHMYRGIWYDDQYCYMVGAAQSLKDRQPRAHLIRRFDVYQGRGSFDMHPLLLTTSVQFVRHDQYTVYPYPFHLIDVYVESVLQYQDEM